MNNLLKTTTVLFLFCIFSFQLYAQNIAINSSGNTGNAAAILDLSDASNNTLGFALPNVSIGNVISANPVIAPPTGLIVYNTNAATTGGFGVGFYYWSGTAWIYIQNSASLSINYIQNQTIPQANANFNIMSATAGSIGGVIEANGVPTVDIFDIDNSLAVPQVYVDKNFQLNAILGLSASGAAVNLNASSNFITNINTGTSTGPVNIGNGTNTALTELGNININNNNGAATTNIGTGTTTGAVTIGGSGNTVNLPAMSTTNGILYTSTAGGEVAQTAALTNGQVLIGSTGNPPVPATITPAANSGISVTNGAGSITIGTNGVLNTITVITNPTVSYTPSAGTKAIQVELIGGGGGGGSSSAPGTNGAAGGGGGAGGYVKFFISNPVGPYTVAVGTGGAAGIAAISNATNGGPGGAGTATTFQGGYSAGGGSGGGVGTANISGFGGNGGLASGGLINVTGASGYSGVGGGSSGAVSGAGGSSVIGGGAFPATETTINSTITGNAGSSNSGGGGSGCATRGGVPNTVIATTGGAGANGIIIITEYK